MGKITDFRRTDKVVGVGLYRITNLELTGKLKDLNDKMRIYTNENVYPSVELEFINDNGGSFDIIEGCWGKTIDMDMDIDKFCTKDQGVKWYAKYVGCMS